MFKGIWDLCTKQDGKSSKSALLLTAAIGIAVLFALVVAFVIVWWVTHDQITPETVKDMGPAVRDMMLGEGGLLAGAGYVLNQYSKHREVKASNGNGATTVVNNQTSASTKSGDTDGE